MLQAHHFYLMMDLYYFCVYTYSDEVLHSLMEAAASVYLQYIRSLDGGGDGSGGLSTPHGPRGTL